MWLIALSVLLALWLSGIKLYKNNMDSFLNPKRNDMLFDCSAVELCSCLLTDLLNSILCIWHWMHLHLIPCFNPWLYLSSPPSLFIHNLCLSHTVMRPLSMSVSFDSSGKDFTVALPLLAHWPCFCGCAWPPRSPLPLCDAPLLVGSWHWS